MGLDEPLSVKLGNTLLKCDLPGTSIIQFVYKANILQQSWLRSRKHLSLLKWKHSHYSLVKLFKQFSDEPKPFGEVISISISDTEAATYTLPCIVPMCDWIANGIDVNARDYAGWTPLHEACNHGNIQCVKELLSFVPAKTMEHYFKKDGIISKKVDLLAVTGEGITPLHDAVLNNKIEVCRLLLKHGGTKLLSAKTALNFTPVDLASSEEMFQLLSSFQVSTHRHSQRIDSLNSSQDSVTSTDNIRTSPPSEQLYEEALQHNGTKLYATKQDILNYIDVVTCLFVSYVQAAELVQVKTTIPKVAKYSSISRCLHKAAIKLRQATGLSEANSQENIEASLSKTETKLERLKILYPSEDVHILKQDIKIVTKLRDYIEMFRGHLMKISNPEDTPFIQNELTEIAWMIEILQN